MKPKTQCMTLVRLVMYFNHRAMAKIKDRHRQGETARKRGKLPPSVIRSRKKQRLLKAPRLTPAIGVSLLELVTPIHFRLICCMLHCHGSCFAAVRGRHWKTLSKRVDPC